MVTIVTHRFDSWNIKRITLKTDLYILFPRSTNFLHFLKWSWNFHHHHTSFFNWFEWVWYKRVAKDYFNFFHTNSSCRAPYQILLKPVNNFDSKFLSESEKKKKKPGVKFTDWHILHTCCDRISKCIFPHAEFIVYKPHICFKTLTLQNFVFLSYSDVMTLFDFLVSLLFFNLAVFTMYLPPALSCWWPRFPPRSTAVPLSWHTQPYLLYVLLMTELKWGWCKTIRGRCT